MKTMAIAENMGFKNVVRTMEEDNDCHSMIFRYCNDILGAVQQEEYSRKPPWVPHVQNIWVDNNIISISF